MRPRTRKIHAAKPKDARPRLTMCDLPQSHRYIRHPAGEAVNCGECLVACQALEPIEHLCRTGIAKRGPHGLPMYTCKRCGEIDEFTSESEAHGICATCMSYANAPERP
jgi:hypothetical protein